MVQTRPTTAIRAESVLRQFRELVDTRVMPPPHAVKQIAFETGYTTARIWQLLKLKGVVPVQESDAFAKRVAEGMSPSVFDPGIPTPETSSDYEIPSAPAPAYNLYVKGTSILEDGEGNVKLRWTKTSEDKSADAIRAMAEALKDDLPRVTVTPSTLNYADDILVVLPMGDPHIGLHAWGEETGDDFDLKIAEQDLCEAVDRLLLSTPPSAECLIANLGDFFHADNMDAETWRSGNRLDVDSRWAKVLRVGVRIMRYCIESAARRHSRVTVINAIGNHDDHSSMFLSVCLGQIYGEDERITVVDAPTINHYYRFGANLIGVHHGHTIKPVDLPLEMAAARPDDWGETRHRIWLTGHLHQDIKREYRGTIVETFRTLAARDAWAASKGYRSGRDMKAIVIHREYGQVERHTMNIEMLKAFRQNVVKSD